jgi:hypothetical protein
VIQNDNIRIYITFEFIYGRHLREIPETYLGRLAISCVSDAFIG